MISSELTQLVGGAFKSVRVEFLRKIQGAYFVVEGFVSLLSKFPLAKRMIWCINLISEMLFYE